MKRTLLVLLLGVLVSNTACAATSMMPPRPRSFEELLASGENDVVVEGTVLEAKETVLKYHGGPACEYEGLSPLRVTELSLRISRSIFGVAEDSVLSVTVLDQGYGYLIGRSVTFWGYRVACDGWRLHGWLGVVDDAGMMTHGNGRPLYRAPNGRMEKVPRARVSALGTGRPFHSSSLYNNARAIAIARLKSSAEWTEYGATYHVEFVGWAVGQAVQMPTEIDFPRDANCFARIFSGDSLLVPIPNGWTPERRLVLPVCPSSLRIKKGFVPGLGVELDQLPQALTQIGQAYWPRLVQRRGQ